MEKEDKLLKLFEESLREIKESKAYQDLLVLREKLAENKEAIALIEEVKSLQKEIVRLEAKKQDSKNKEDELFEVQNKLFAIPLYSEYYYLNEEIQLELDMLSKTVEAEIAKITG